MTVKDILKYLPLIGFVIAVLMLLIGAVWYLFLIWNDKQAIEESLSYILSIIFAFMGIINYTKKLL